MEETKRIDTTHDPTEEVAYVYVVHGSVPEFMPHTAFRREKHFQTVRRKIIKCPYCRNAFTTVDDNERVELYRHSKKASVIYHDSMPCRTCHGVVGIIYSSA
jgi:hypothetical protein